MAGWSGRRMCMKDSETWQMTLVEFEGIDRAEWEQHFPPGTISPQRITRTPNGLVVEGGHPVPEWTKTGALVQWGMAMCRAITGGEDVPVRALREFETHFLGVAERITNQRAKGSDHA